MTTKHTAGPWTFKLASGNISKTHIFNADKSYCHAWVFAETKEEERANARLIAAAPCLLEACMKLVTEIYHHPDGVEVLISDDPIQEMIAAIEKAMGGNSWNKATGVQP
jgi:hypothetical protein